MLRAVLPGVDTSSHRCRLEVLLLTKPFLSAVDEASTTVARFTQAIFSEQKLQLMPASAMPCVIAQARLQAQH
jgi:hypothetical protein